MPRCSILISRRKASPTFKSLIAVSEELHRGFGVENASSHRERSEVDAYELSGKIGRYRMPRDLPRGCYCLMKGAARAQLPHLHDLHV